jgi:hypothetical protein
LWVSILKPIEIGVWRDGGSKLEFRQFDPDGSYYDQAHALFVELGWTSVFEEEVSKTPALENGKLYDALAERVWAAVMNSAAFKQRVFQFIDEYLKSKNVG